MTRHRSLQEIDVLALLAGATVTVLGYLVRQTVNPDGVAYADLASALRHGEWSHFVQGYWSPLYPGLLALAGAMGRLGIPGTVAAGHAINVIAVLATIVVLWRWGRQPGYHWFGRASIAALMLCSAAPPRVEALTPDLILLFIATVIAWQLLGPQRERPVLLGVLFGFAYLVKTSCWPWILVATMVRLGAASGRADRLRIMKSQWISIAIAACWIIPMSVAAGHLTLGSTGPLNYRWYIESSDSRTPDTHEGTHRAQRDMQIDGNTHVQWTAFDDPAWTYQPWSDPDHWSAGVITDHRSRPVFGKLLSYWFDALRQLLLQWTNWLLLAVLIPALIIGWPRLRRPRDANRRSIVVMLLGAAGIAQFIVVHAEPRLIAPFTAMFAFGALHLFLADATSNDDTAPPARRSHPLRELLCWAGVIAAAFVAGRRIVYVRQDERRIADGLEQLNVAVQQAISSSNAAGAPSPFGSAAPAASATRAVVIGPVMPVLANIYWSGERVVAQIAPSQVPLLESLTPTARQAALTRIFHGHADIVWLTSSRGDFTLVPVP